MKEVPISHTLSFLFFITAFQHAPIRTALYNSSNSSSLNMNFFPFSLRRSFSPDDTTRCPEPFNFSTLPSRFIGWRNALSQSILMWVSKYSMMSLRSGHRSFQYSLVVVLSISGITTLWPML